MCIVCQLHRVVTPRALRQQPERENIHQPLVRARDRLELLQSLKLALERFSRRVPITPHDLHRAPCAGRIPGQPHLAISAGSDGIEQFVVGDLHGSKLRLKVEIWTPKRRPHRPQVSALLPSRTHPGARGGRTAEIVSRSLSLSLEPAHVVPKVFEPVQQTVARGQRVGRRCGVRRRHFGLSLHLRYTRGHTGN
jgi:hypothetical protein